MSKLQPLLDRDRYDDEEWVLASAGKCAWRVAKPLGIGSLCGQPSARNSFYRWCTEHDRDARKNYPSQSYGR